MSTDFRAALRSQDDAVDWIDRNYRVLRLRPSVDEDDEDDGQARSPWNLRTLGPDDRLVGTAEQGDHDARTLCWIVSCGRAEVADQMYRSWLIADVYRAYAVQRVVEYRPTRKQK